MSQPGVNSEAGALRTVMVHRPGLELERLTPANREDFLFDDVVWVERAQREHDDFTEVLRDRGVEVLYLQELLAETLAADSDGRRHIVERAVSSYTVGLSLVEELRGWLFAQERDRLAEILVGGLLISELDGLDLEALNRHSLGAMMAEHDSFVLPPLPNTMFTRDSSCWLYGGVVLPPLFWYARRLEVSNVSDGLPLPSPVRRRGVPLLVSGRLRPRTVRGRGLRPGRIARGRRHHARSATRRCSWAWASVPPAAWSSTSRARSSLPRPRSASSPVAWSPGPVLHAPRHRASASSTATLSRSSRRSSTRCASTACAPGTAARFDVTEETRAAARRSPTRSACASCASSRPEATLPVRARAVVRREQRRRARAGLVRRLRAQHEDERQAARGRHRGHRDRRRRARQGPGRLPLHDLPARARRPVGPLTAVRRAGETLRRGMVARETR